MIEIILVKGFCPLKIEITQFANGFQVKLNFRFKLSYVNLNFTLTLGYLNPALNNPAQNVSPCNFYVFSIYIMTCTLVLYSKRKSSITALAPLTTKFISKQARLTQQRAFLLN